MVAVLNATANILMAVGFLVAGLPILIRTLHEVKMSRLQIDEVRRIVDRRSDSEPGPKP